MSYASHYQIMPSIQQSICIPDLLHSTTVQKDCSEERVSSTLGTLSFRDLVIRVSTSLFVHD